MYRVLVSSILFLWQQHNEMDQTKCHWPKVTQQYYMAEGGFESGPCRPLSSTNYYTTLAFMVRYYHTCCMLEYRQKIYLGSELGCFAS